MNKIQGYQLNLIFKGLFRCVRDKENNRLSILLVDARSPKKNSNDEPLRDHRAVLEFHLKDWVDWKNQASKPLPGFVEINKRNKGEVGLYLLNGEDIRIETSCGDLSPGLAFIEDDSPNSFLKLPQMENIAAGFAAVKERSLNDDAEGCIARVLGLRRGIVSSERLSTLGGEPLHWTFSVPRKEDVVEELKERDPSDPEKAQLHEELSSNGKTINLDLRVTMQVPGDADVLIDAIPFPSTVRFNAPAFRLRPAEGGSLDVWIKNRELQVVLTESDQEGAEEGCLDASLVDFDFELLYNLSTENDQDIKRIPYRSDALDDNDVSLGGCACGGCA